MNDFSTFALDLLMRSRSVGSNRIIRYVGMGVWWVMEIEWSPLDVIAHSCLQLMPSRMFLERRSSNWHWCQEIHLIWYTAILETIADVAMVSVSYSLNARGGAKLLAYLRWVWLDFGWLLSSMKPLDHWPGSVSISCKLDYRVSGEWGRTTPLSGANN